MRGGPFADEYSAPTDEVVCISRATSEGTKIYLYLFVVCLTTLLVYWYTVNIRALVNAVAH